MYELVLIKIINLLLIALDPVVFRNKTDSQIIFIKII